MNQRDQGDQGDQENQENQENQEHQENQNTQIPVRIAAAANLADAFAELAPIFTEQTGREVVFSFGSSGLLARQLREGAPFDAFAAANLGFVDEVVAAAACDGTTKTTYARGQLVLWVREGPAPQTLADLQGPRFTRIAIANPEHAPYGFAATAALERAGLLGTLRPRLVFGENVRQALQFAETGNADAAIVAQSLVHRATSGALTVIDPALYPPLDQGLVVCNHGADQAGGAAFARLVASPTGQAILEAHGFGVPEPAPAPAR